MRRAFTSLAVSLAACAGAAVGCVPTDRPLVDPATWPPVTATLLVPRAATGVPTNVTVRIGLDLAAVPEDVTGESVRLEAGGASVAASVSWIALEREIVVRPASDLPPGAEVTVTVGPAIRSYGGPRLTGQRMAEAQTFRFTTGAGPDTTPPELVGTLLVYPEAFDDPDACDLSLCGDGVCTDPGGAVDPTTGAFVLEEGDCRADCPEDCCSLAACGDGICQQDECGVNCPGDCARPFVLRTAFRRTDCSTAGCGDGSCAANECPESCPGDCPASVVRRAEFVEGFQDDASPGGELRFVAYVSTAPGGQDFSGPTNAVTVVTLNEYRILGLGSFPTACGDGACSGIENPVTCPADCPDACGDAVCTGAENAGSCPTRNLVPDATGDCVRRCGDGTCTAPENDPMSTAFCAADCPGSCGDGAATCDAGESCASCPVDCGACCGDGLCDVAIGEPRACAVDCPASCGDGVCLGAETPESCAADCRHEYFVVLRAVDAAGNESTNTAEIGVTTGPALIDDTDGDGVPDAPSWAAARAAPACETCQNCHGGEPGPADYWMPTYAWAPGSDDPDPYALVVGTPSREVPSMSFVEPGNLARSYLPLKWFGRECTVRLFGVSIAGFSMGPDEPVDPPICSSRIERVPRALMDWIDYGAPRNTPELAACGGK